MQLLSSEQTSSDLSKKPSRCRFTVSLVTLFKTCKTLVIQYLIHCVLSFFLIELKEDEGERKKEPTRVENIFLNLCVIAFYNCMLKGLFVCRGGVYYFFSAQVLFSVTEGLETFQSK